MWHCKTCNEKFYEPGTWNANTKKFLCANCLSPLSDEAVEQRLAPDNGGVEDNNVQTVAYSFAKLFAGKTPRCA